MKHLFRALVVVGLSLISVEAEAAPKKFAWGQQTGQAFEGIFFHRQRTNISRFTAYVPVLCVAVDGHTYENHFQISGEDVPNMLVESGAVEAEFDYTDDSTLSPPGNVLVQISFRGERATANIFVSAEDSELTCTGSVTYSRIRRGARVR